MKEQIVSKLYEMKLIGMAKGYEEKSGKPDHRDLSFEEFLSMLVDDEYIYRRNQKQARLLHLAKLKYPAACFEDIDYRTARGINKAKMVSLQNEEWFLHYCFGRVYIGGIHTY